MCKFTKPPKYLCKTSKSTSHFLLYPGSFFLEIHHAAEIGKAVRHSHMAHKAMK